MHNTTMVEIIRHHSVSKNKDRFISGDLHATRDDIKSRLMQNFHEKSTIRKMLTEYALEQYKAPLSDLKDMHQVQKELALSYIEGSENEDLFWREQLFDVEYEINYHDNLVFVHLNGLIAK